MKRDMDLIRDVLLKLEGMDKPAAKNLTNDEDTDEDYQKLLEHLQLLIDEAGFVSGISAHSAGGKYWLDLRLTWEGHEYLDTIRDAEIWSLTKDKAQKVGGFSVEVLGAIAKGLIKKKIEDHSGVEIDL